MDGVADGHEESIVNDQDIDVNYQIAIESLGDSGAARPMCSSGGTKFSPLNVPELMQTICMQCPLSSGGANRGC